MGKSRRFRNILSLILIGLYGFIITPVVYWHSHPDTIHVRSGGKEGQVLKAAHSCFVCDHSYASYISGEEQLPAQVPASHHQYADTKACVIISLPVLHRNTRGSPLA